MKSRLYMNGTLRSWIHYIDLRKTNGTQKEHMEIAKLVVKKLLRFFLLLKAGFTLKEDDSIFNAVSLWSWSLVIE